MEGPAGVWFGVGLDASNMADLPYTITVDGSTGNQPNPQSHVLGVLMFSSFTPFNLGLISQFVATIVPLLSSDPRWPWHGSVSITPWHNALSPHRTMHLCSRYATCSCAVRLPTALVRGDLEWL